MNRAPLIAVALAFIPAIAVAAESDAYAPLKRYEGKWIATSSGGKTTAIENRCARTGLFFVCEQGVNGKAAALVVFLPRAQEGPAEVYRTQALTAAGDRPGPWHVLTIEGDRWVYADAEAPRGKARRERTINTFSGPDHIHFEVQRSFDGKTWTTTMSGDERRAP